MRCRTNITPLYIACVNEYCPIEIIKYILKYSPDEYQYIYLNSYKVNITNDIKQFYRFSDNIYKKRYYILVDLILNKFSQKKKNM